LRHNIWFDGTLLHAHAGKGRCELPNAFERRSIGGTNEKRRDRRRLACPLVRLVRGRTRKQFANQLVATP
jgi:hypothetical protein